MSEDRRKNIDGELARRLERKKKSGGAGAPSEKKRKAPASGSPLGAKRGKVDKGKRPMVDPAPSPETPRGRKGPGISIREPGASPPRQVGGTVSASSTSAGGMTNAPHVTSKAALTEWASYLVLGSNKDLSKLPPEASLQVACGLMAQCLQPLMQSGKKANSLEGKVASLNEKLARMEMHRDELATELEQMANEKSQSEKQEEEMRCLLADKEKVIGAQLEEIQKLREKVRTLEADNLGWEADYRRQSERIFAEFVNGMRRVKETLEEKCPDFDLAVVEELIRETEEDEDQEEGEGAGEEVEEQATLVSSPTLNPSSALRPEGEDVDTSRFLNPVTGNPFTPDGETTADRWIEEAPAEGDDGGDAE